MIEAAPRLGELVAAHLEALARAWTPQTRHQHSATLRLFLEHAGDRPVDGIARRGRGAVRDLPPFPVGGGGKVAPARLWK